MGAERPFADGLGECRVSVAARHAPLRGRQRDSHHGDGKREETEAEHRPVGVRTDIEIEPARQADRKSRGQAQRDDERGARADDGGECGRYHQRAGGHTAIGAHRAPRRRSAAPALTARTRA